jgi:hypothetical protein
MYNITPQGKGNSKKTLNIKKIKIETSFQMKLTRSSALFKSKQNQGA